MNIEEEYYENDDFWRPENVLEVDIERAKSIYELIPKDVENILDVGSGNGIFLNFLDSKNEFPKLLGLDRSSAALRYIKTPKIKSTIDSLPFRDNQFDLVSCLEVLEHLPNRIYQKSLGEICRVSSKYVLISVPNQQILENSLIECQQCKTKFNPDFHMRSFNEEMMKGLLIGFDMKCIGIYYIGICNKFFIISNVRAFLASRNKKNYFPTEIPCPVCGCYQEASKRSASLSDIHGKYRPLIKKYWPKKFDHLWIIGAYKK